MLHHVLTLFLCTVDYVSSLVHAEVCAVIEVTVAQCIHLHPFAFWSWFCVCQCWQRCTDSALPPILRSQDRATSWRGGVFCSCVTHAVGHRGCMWTVRGAVMCKSLTINSTRLGKVGLTPIAADATGTYHLPRSSWLSPSCSSCSKVVDHGRCVNSRHAPWWKLHRVSLCRVRGHTLDFNVWNWKPRASKLGFVPSPRSWILQLEQLQLVAKLWLDLVPLHLDQQLVPVRKKQLLKCSSVGAPPPTSLALARLWSFRTPLKEKMLRWCPLQSSALLLELRCPFAANASTDAAAVVATACNFIVLQSCSTPLCLSSLWVLVSHVSSGVFPFSTCMSPPDSTHLPLLWELTAICPSCGG